SGGPGIHIWFSLGANRKRGLPPFGLDPRGSAEKGDYAMGQRNAGARSPHDVKFGRRCISAGDGIQRTRGSKRIALDRMMDALGNQCIADCVDRIVEQIQLGFEHRPGLLKALRARFLRESTEESFKRVKRRRAWNRIPLSVQRKPVDYVV